MKLFVFKRIGAFILDYLIVMFIASIITMGFNNNSDKISNELNDVLQRFNSGDITIEEYNESIYDINYELQKSNLPVNIVSSVLFIGYYIVFTCLNKGQTIGKKLFKLRVVNKNDKGVKVGNMFLRSIFIYSILSSLFSAIFINILSVKLYSYISIGIEYVEYGFIIISLFMISLRKDGRGLHDIMSSTKVIEVK